MSNPKWEEQILVAPVDKVFEGIEKFNGALTDGHSIDILFDNIGSNVSVMRRGNTNDPTPAENNAEINFNFKQPIPYAVIKQGDMVFAYQRLSGGGEARLHDKISLGVGGHMNPHKDEEASFLRTMLVNLNRELDEELIIDMPEGGKKNLQVIGFINDEEEEVSRVHIGIMVILELPEGADVAVREVDQLAGYWYSIEDLSRPEYYDQLEGWSKIVIDTLTDSQTVKS